MQLDIFKELKNLVRHFPHNLNDQLKSELESLFQYCKEGMDSDSKKLLTTIMIKSLNKRICSDSIEENIYNKKYEISQIQLFNILIDKFPFVKYSQQSTNNAIIDLMRRYEEITIIDIGIGQGTQILNILNSAKDIKSLKKVVIVGIEPFPDALNMAETNIRSMSVALPFELTFVSICEYVEKIDFSAIPELTDNIIVNASLALHHIQSSEQRIKTIESIKNINPVAFLLIEPNVNHFEPDFNKRFANCFHHFYSIFKVIDKIDIDQNDKNALKLFFGREIEDILGKEEKDRFEKHEPAEHWIKMLRQNKFTIASEMLVAPVKESYGVEISTHKEGFMGFTHDQETVLAVIYAN